jgi:hypothetical protein
MNALSHLMLLAGSQTASCPSKPMLCLDHPLLLESSDLFHLKISTEYMQQLGMKIRSTHKHQVTAALMLAIIEN